MGSCGFIHTSVPGCVLYWSVVAHRLLLIWHTELYRKFQFGTAHELIVYNVLTVEACKKERKKENAV